MAETNNLAHNGRMATFEIREARVFDCGRIVRMLRPDHESAYTRVGIGSHRELRRAFDDSYFRKAWIVDGHLAGIGGLRGSTLSPRAYIWLALTDRATRYPIEMVKEARRQIADIMVTKNELLTTVHADDRAAQRFALFLGFHVGDQPAAETHFGRKTLQEYILSTPEVRVPFGKSHLIRMGYHGAADAAAPSLAH
jgi:hypothetical protein